MSQKTLGEEDVLLDPPEDPRDAVIADQQARIAALEAQVRQYEAAFNNVSQGVCFFDGEGRLILSNRYYAEIYRLSPEQITPGATLREISERRFAAGTSPMAVDDYLTLCGSINDSGKPRKWIADLQDGRTIAISHQPMPDGGWVSTHEDITEQKASRTVSTELISLQALIDWVPDYLWVKDTASRFVVVNKALAHDSGKSRTSDMIGLSDFDLHEPEAAQVFHDIEQEIVRSGKPIIDREEMIVSVTGEKKCLLSTKVPLRNDHNEIFGLVGIARDITARKIADQRFLAITSNLFEGVILVDALGSVMFANKSAQRWLGRADAAGCRLDDLMGVVHGGTPHPFSDGLLRQVIEGGETVIDDDAVFVSRDGRHLRVAYAVSALVEDDGRHAAILSFRSIEALKEAQSEALQSSRLASVGQLAAGIAHEINTPIQYIGDNLRFLRDSFQNLAEAVAGMDGLLAGSGVPEADWQRLRGEKDVDYLLEEMPLAAAQSLSGVEHVAHIVRSMKEFSHPGSTAKVATDINRAIDSTVTVSRNEWKQLATLETDLAPDLPAIVCFPAEINQVLLNLIVNAAHAIEAADRGQPGVIRIATRRDGDMIEIRVSDTGTGIPDSIRAQIFDPFFTTKPVGKGTGQGLAISQDVIVNKHGGRLLLDETVAVGATFIIRLPINTPAADAASGES